MLSFGVGRHAEAWVDTHQLQVVAPKHQLLSIVVCSLCADVSKLEQTAGAACLLAGHDNCVCLAVAVLSGCFAPPAAAAESKLSVAEPSFAGTWQPDSQQEAEQSTLQQLQQCMPQLPAVPVSKQSVRQQLALVSGCFPLARPTRAMLKQVFNFFAERSHHS
jgi:hypothetical protein